MTASCCSQAEAKHDSIDHIVSYISSLQEMNHRMVYALFITPWLLPKNQACIPNVVAIVVPSPIVGRPSHWMLRQTSVSPVRPRWGPWDWQRGNEGQMAIRRRLVDRDSWQGCPAAYERLVPCSSSSNQTLLLLLSFLPFSPRFGRWLVDEGFDGCKWGREVQSWGLTIHQLSSLNSQEFESGSSAVEYSLRP